MEKKIGLYICKGCGIADAVDVEKLEKNVKKMPVCKTHDVLCSPAGLSMIKGDMASEGVNTLVIAACSPRVKFAEFDFPGALVERANIREFVAWTLEAKSDQAKSAAEDYINMAIVKAQKSELPQPNVLADLNSTVLVIGGGIAGMNAALAAANAGHKVVVVEKDATLGGFVNKLYIKIPPAAVYQEPLIVDTEIEQPVMDVEGNSHIKVFKST